jgi:hypothetical protein
MNEMTCDYCSGMPPGISWARRLEQKVDGIFHDTTYHANVVSVEQNLGHFCRRASVFAEEHISIIES